VSRFSSRALDSSRQCWSGCLDHNLTVLLLLAFGAFLLLAAGLTFIRERALNVPPERDASAGQNEDAGGVRFRTAPPTPLVIGTRSEAARTKVEKWIRRGEEIEEFFVELPSSAPKGVKPDGLILLIDHLTKSERPKIEAWHRGVVNELSGIGGGALGLYTANEPMSHGLFTAIHDNRRFLRERLDELREILGRIDRPSRERTVEAARRIRTELIDAQRKATTYIDAVAKMPPTSTIHYERGFRFKTGAWDEQAAALASDQNTYAVVETAYQELGRANDVIGWRETGATGLYGVNRDEDDLPAVARAAGAAIDAVNELLRDES
jgi:hypothetical protein